MGGTVEVALYVALWAMGCGALGGVLNFLRNLDHTSQIVKGTQQTKKFTGWTYLGLTLGTRSSWVSTLARDAALGAGGALVMLGVVSQVTDLPGTNLGKLLGASVTLLVAGFIGRSVLIVAGEKLRRDLNEQREQTQMASTKAEEALAEAQDQRLHAVAVAQLGTNQPAYLPSLAHDLRKLQERKPQDRITAILLGRAYRRLNQLPKAIDALSRFLEATQTTEVEFRVDRADIHYNRSCYRALTGDIPGAFEDLEKAVDDGSGENKALARTDSDLTPLVSADRLRFEKLIGAPTTPELAASSSALNVGAPAVTETAPSAALPKSEP